MSFDVPDKVLVKISNPNQKIGYSVDTFVIPDGWREATEEEYAEHVKKVADANGYKLETQEAKTPVKKRTQAKTTKRVTRKRKQTTAKKTTTKSS